MAKDTKDFQDYSQWLNAATDAGYTVEAHPNDQDIRLAFDSGREPVGRYRIPNNHGTLDVDGAPAGAQARPEVPLINRQPPRPDNDGDALSDSKRLSAGSQPADDKPVVGTPPVDDDHVAPGSSLFSDPTKKAADRPVP